MQTAVLIDRVQKCLELGEAFKQARYTDRNDVLQRNLYGKWYNQTTTCLMDIYGERHPYTINFQKTCGFINFPGIDEGLGILTAAKEDIESGFLTGLYGLISAEIFSDVLEMAEHLLEEKYKDPAAVIVGTALEAHLKTVSKTHGVEIDFVDGKGDVRQKKASMLNQELCKEGLYNKLDEKLITAWLDLRNKAAHGHFDEYTIEQVRTMFLGVTDFINRAK